MTPPRRLTMRSWLLTLLEYALVAQLALVPLVALGWPSARARYLGRWRRWLGLQAAVAVLGLVAVAVLPRPY